MRPGPDAPGASPGGGIPARNGAQSGAQNGTAGHEGPLPDGAPPLVRDALAAGHAEAVPPELQNAALQDAPPPSAPPPSAPPQNVPPNVPPPNALLQEAALQDAPLQDRALQDRPAPAAANGGPYPAAAPALDDPIPDLSPPSSSNTSPNAPVPNGPAPNSTAANGTAANNTIPNNTGPNGLDSAPPATRPPQPGRAAPGTRTARHRASSSSARTGRKFMPRGRRARLVTVAVVTLGVIIVGLFTGVGAERSAEPTAQAFLYDWEQQEYSAAGALTTAEPATVATSLSSVLGQLDTSQFFLSMKSVVQHGNKAEATFNATVDLADSERVWSYQGRFGLREVGGGWKVVWVPSVINPSLGAGERLAVLNQYPDRAPVLDAKGAPLQQTAPAYVLGVWPQQLKNPSQTASDFAKIARVQTGQVLGQIMAAPPQQFLHLATLDASTYASLRSSLHGVPGLVVYKTSARLYQTTATGLVGDIGSEIDPVLRADGAIYAPGSTVGLNGLEHAYQHQLLGTPTTEVVTVNPDGKQTAVLSRWPGTAGTPLRTTIDSGVQSAALNVLNANSSSGELVAISASTGQVLAVAQHQGPVTLPAAGPLAAKLTPGTAFTIVSAAAVLNQGVKLSDPVPCANSFNVGGQTFTSDNTGQQRSFSTDFAQGCSTAFAGLSERFSPSQFLQTVREFGIGSTWNLPVPAFSGSVPSAANDAGLAAQTVGQGNVQASPLSMAMVAGSVDSGSWHVPQVVQAAPGAVAQAATPLPSDTVTALHSLMREAVTSGAAKAARASGGQVYGQVGLVHTGSTWASWFVGYQGDIAIAVVEYGKTAQLSAAALAGQFFSAADH